MTATTTAAGISCVRIQYRFIQTSGPTGVVSIGGEKSARNHLSYNGYALFRR
jgi:hypothetical protein